MQTNAISTNPSMSSYMMDDSPLVFGNIFEESVSVSCWNRPSNKVINAYFASVLDALKFGIRNVFTVSELQENLRKILPDGIGKEQAVKDIHLLADMLTCLLDCKEVGLRLVVLNQPMCPKFHVDNIPVRLVTTYLGPGTEWVPNEWADSAKPGLVSTSTSNENSIQQLNPFDVALLKGSAWGENHTAAIHRSCGLKDDQWRVLLTMDPI
jgi:hypothetical protein